VEADIPFRDSTAAPRPADIEAAALPPGVVSLAEALAELAAELPALRAALNRPPAPPIDRMPLRIDEVADALGGSRRTIEREPAAGRFPKPDLTIGKMPLWRPETVRGWLDKGGGR